MPHSLKTALLSVSVFLGWIQASTLADADERDRSRAEPRQETRAPGRPGPRPAGRPAFDGRGQVLDSRYNHGRYYPPRGTVLRSLPDGYRPYYRGGSRFYFSGGIWYAPRGPQFVVGSPPPGLIVPGLPPLYSPPWVGGPPFHHAQKR